MTVARLVLGAAMVWTLAPGAHACDGNYCGMYYCGGGLVWDDERASCAFGQGPVGCADACCHAHDACCYNTSTLADCNTHIVACLDGCEASDGWGTDDTMCLYGMVAVPMPWARTAMRLIKHWCCSGPC